MIIVDLEEAEKYLENDRAMLIDTSKHDADLLDKVAEKIREHSGLHYVDCDGYFGGQEELILVQELVFTVDKLLHKERRSKS